MFWIKKASVRLWKKGRKNKTKHHTLKDVVLLWSRCKFVSSQAGGEQWAEAEKRTREHGLLDEGRSESFPRLFPNPSPAPMCALAFTFKWNQTSEHWQMKYSSATGNKKAPPPCFLEGRSRQETVSFRQRYRVIYEQQRLSFTQSRGMKENQRDKSGHGLLTYTWPYQRAASEWCRSVSVSQPGWLVISTLKMVQSAPFSDPHSFECPRLVLFFQANVFTRRSALD